jgi:transcriptional regulator with XRE-family HTH domain
MSKNKTDDEIRREIGRKIKAIRAQQRLKAFAVATKLKISREALTHIETGRNNVNAVMLWKLAALFKCEVADFFPVIPDGFGFTENLYDKIAKENEKAARWARETFSQE